MMWPICQRASFKLQVSRSQRQCLVETGTRREDACVLITEKMLKLAYKLGSRIKVHPGRTIDAICHKFNKARPDYNLSGDEAQQNCRSTHTSLQGCPRSETEDHVFAIQTQDIRYPPSGTVAHILKDPWPRSMHALHVDCRPDSLPCREGRVRVRSEVCRRIIGGGKRWMNLYISPTKSSVSIVF